MVFLCVVFVLRNYCWKIQLRTLLPMSMMHSVRHQQRLVVELIDSREVDC